jgi:hypothetical protein
VLSRCNSNPWVFVGIFAVSEAANDIRHSADFAYLQREIGMIDILLLVSQDLVKLCPSPVMSVASDEQDFVVFAVGFAQDVSVIDLESIGSIATRSRITLFLLKGVGWGQVRIAIEHSSIPSTHEGCWDVVTPRDS